MIKENRLLLYATGGFLFFIDQILKYVARVNPDKIYLWKGFVGWEYFENIGIAFSLPLPNFLVIFITPLILIGFTIFLNTKKKFGLNEKLSIFFIALGAISNYIDRVLLGFTVDYIRIFTSVINIADIMIVIGVLLLIFISKNKNTDSKICLQK